MSHFVSLNQRCLKIQTPFKSWVGETFFIYFFVNYFDLNLFEIATSLTNEKNSITQLEKANRELKLKNEHLENQLLEYNVNQKREIDLLMAKFYDGITDRGEKEEIKKIFITKQQENNEKVMNEQAKLIESLKFKCKRLETEMNKGGRDSVNEKKISSQIEEIAALKTLVHRLNNELSHYQVKYSTNDKNVFIFRVFFDIS